MEPNKTILLKFGRLTEAIKENPDFLLLNQRLNPNGEPIRICIEFGDNPESHIYRVIHNTNRD
jgi:hypothetical protein